MLIALLGLTLQAEPSQAECLPDAASVVDGDSVSCTGTNTDAYTVPDTPTPINEVTVTIEEGASFNVDGPHAVSVNDLGGIVNLGTIDVGTDATAGLVTGSDALVENFGDINASGLGATGIVLGASSEFGINDGEPTTGTINLSADGAIGISGTESNVAYQWGSLTSTADQTTGIQLTNTIQGQGGSASNRGNMVFSSADSTGISVGDYSGAGNSSTGSMTFEGDNNVGVNVGNSSFALNDGSIVMQGDGSTGMRAGNGDGGFGEQDNPSQIFNLDGARVEVSGENVVGAQIGQFGIIRNQGELLITGVGSTGIRTGADSFVSSNGAGAEIRVSGAGSIGVDLAGRTEGEELFVSFANEQGARLISEDPTAGPLIRIGAGTQTNQINNTGYKFDEVDGSEIPSLISAYVDESNPNVNPGVAIQGSSSEDRISNGADIQGLVLLGEGDDTYQNYLTGQIRDLGTGTLDGGAGSDTLDLSVEEGRPNTGTGTFDLGLVRDFETIRVSEGRWLVSGAPTPEVSGQTDMTVASGATLRIESPLSIPGDYSHEAPALPEDPKAQVEILLSPETEGGDVAILTVEGAADLSNGELEIELAPGVLEGGEFILIESGEDLTTQFDSVTEPEISISQESTLTYTTRGLEFTLQLAPMSANQQVTGGYLDALPTTGLSPQLESLVSTINNDLTYSEYLDALDQIMPEAYDAQAAATLELANQYTDLLLSRPNYCVVKPGEESVHPTSKQTCQKRTFEPWMNLYGQRSERTGTDGHISYHDEGGGLIVGFDHRVNPQLLLTASAGVAYDIIHVDNVGKGRLGTVDIGFAASWADGPLRLQGAATYGYGWNTRYREIDIGDFVSRARGEYQMNRVGLRARAEYGFRFGRIQVAPLASLDYTALIRPGITETEGGAANLYIDGTTDNITTIRVGVDLGSALHKEDYWTELLENADGVWRPQLSVAWRQVVTGAHRDITSRLLGAPGQTFTIQADAADRGFEVGAGIDWSPALINRFTFGIHYDAFVWKDVFNQAIMGQVRFSF
ncbi:MAG: autotransporter domain-containing protein [Myxococcota bacterium]|nr:autotransporter domain-containing protein [Myxococcota bacterium]